MYFFSGFKKVTDEKYLKAAGKLNKTISSINNIFSFSGFDFAQLKPFYGTMFDEKWA